MHRPPFLRLAPRGDRGDGGRPRVAGRARSGASPLLALRFATFRVLVLIQLTNAVAVWIHVVATQWTLTDAGRSATEIAFVPAALSLPFLVLCLPVGVLAGRASPVRMMAAATASSAAASCGAAALALVSPDTLWLLLLTVLAIGSSLVTLAIAWQSQIPHLVDRPALASAALVDGATFNLARAVGPVVAGLGLALLGAATTFALTAALFATCTLGLLGAAPRGRRLPASRETLTHAVAGGLRFTRNSPWTLRLLRRLCLFGVPSAALWGLLPVVAHARLDLDARGFGLLFGMVGLGAVAGTALLTPVRARLSVNHFGFVGSGAFAATLLALALASEVAVAAVLLVLGGAAWVGVQTTWMTAAHQALPEWVRPRVVALILLAFQGCQAVGALLWGAAADLVGVTEALVASAALMAVAAIGFLRRGLYDSDGIEPEPAPESMPVLHGGIEPDGAIRVQITYVPSTGKERDFLEAIASLRLSRRRLGAGHWELLVDPTEPGAYVEAFPLGSWANYVEAETVRLTVPELKLRERLRDLLVEEPRVRVLVSEPLIGTRRGAGR